MPMSAVPCDCLPSRLARASRHLDRGEWASGHFILSGLRACASRGGCPEGGACAAAAELMLGDIRSLVGERKRAYSPQS